MGLLVFLLGMLLGYIAWGNIKKGEGEITLDFFKRYNFAIIHSTERLALSIVTAILLSFSFILVNSSSFQYAEGSYKFIIFLLITLITFIFVRLSVEDAREKALNHILALAGIVTLTAVNLVLITRNGLDTEVILWTDNYIEPFSNIFAGVIAASLFGIIYLVTNKKGIGIGDIYVATLLGLSLGLERTIVAVYVAMLIAIGYSFYRIIEKKRKDKRRKQSIEFKDIRNFQIPFTPFLAIGGFITLFFWPTISGLF